MQYNYEILRLEPQNEFVSIRYFADGRNNYFYNTTPRDFTDDHIKRVIAYGGELAVEFWNRTDQHPESLNVPLEGAGQVAPKQPVPPKPDYDSLTQYVELDGTAWVVHDMTEAQRQQALDDWRNKTSITPRQARLALLNEGKLDDLELAFAQLPQDAQDRAIVEWEYASKIERSSAWVNEVGGLLGYTADDLDALFTSAHNL